MEISRSALERYNTDLLAAGIAHGQQESTKWTEFTGRAQQQLATAEWEGQTFEAGMRRATGNTTVAYEASTVNEAAAITAGNLAAALMDLHGQLMATIELAEDPDAFNGQFQVGEDLIARDTQTSYPSAGWADMREAEGINHTMNIQAAAARLIAADIQGAADMTAHTAALTGITFPHNGIPVTGGGIQLAGHGFKTDGMQAPYEPGFDPGPPPPVRVGDAAKNPTLEHPSAIINQHPTPPPDPSKHPCGPLEIATDTGEAIAGAVGIGGGIAAAPTTGGASLAAVPPGVVGVLKSFQDFEHCEPPQ